MATSPPSQSPQADRDDRIISPFAQTVTSVEPAAGRSGGSWALWIVSVVLVLVVGGNIAYFSWTFFHNPYRTLEPFPLDKYLADFQPLAGGKFGANLKVVADLGWKEGVGRLMVFAEPNDDRPILVMMPPKLASLYFAKGQTYQVAMEIGEGGLIYADSCDKD